MAINTKTPEHVVKRIDRDLAKDPSPHNDPFDWCYKVYHGDCVLAEFRVTQVKERYIISSWERPVAIAADSYLANYLAKRAAELVKDGKNQERSYADISKQIEEIGLSF